MTKVGVLARGGSGAVATVVMTFEQPLDQRLFDSKYDDVEILGKLVTRGDHWQPVGFAPLVPERDGRKCPWPAVLRAVTLAS